MDSSTRFEIIAPLGQGDFATVYRARDRELGREVAIKQIHQQFLQDPRQLERYWQEAQLLATLEHPHVMTIYDIVRERGWLVLELMQGSLQGLLAGKPIDLNDLRMAILFTANALQFLQQHGIFHGDVKPGNLMVDKGNRVKLGDFGIARRLVGEHGSVVKGTTKYMAPEVFSDQFGAVGPHSDLYSLGFTAYELMCGENFESLFPGLNMFGKDRQMAWMMWHAAPDRRLPDINRVLQGVPEDLAHVIQRLIEKDPAKRYQRAEDVIADLQGANMAKPGPTAAEQAAAELVAKQAKQKRWIAIGALATSCTLSVAMLFLSPGDKPKPQQKIIRPTAGVVGDVDQPNRRLFLKGSDPKDSQWMPVDVELDRIFINDKKGTFAELQSLDRLTIKYLSSDGQEFREIYASRPEEDVVAGAVKQIKQLDDVLVLQSDDLGEVLDVFVPSSTKFQFNGQATLDGRVMKLADLKPTDHVTVTHIPEDGGRLIARSIQVLRALPQSGMMTARNGTKRTITIQPAVGKVRELSVADNCAITLNGAANRNDVPFKLDDLLPGDQVTLTAHAEVLRIEARRDTGMVGSVSVVDLIQKTISVVNVSGNDERRFFLSAATKLELSDPPQDVELEFLRKGDQLSVEFEKLNEQKLQATRIVVTPSPEKNKWAIIIGQQHFDDAAVPELLYAKHDALAVRNSLVGRYRISSDQALVLLDAGRQQLEQELATFSRRVTPGSELVCYVVGHVWNDANLGVILPTKDFDSTNPLGTGKALRWLVDQLEAAPASNKLLLLDTCHELSGTVPALQLSAAEQALRLKPAPKRPISPSVTIMGSCGQGQRVTGLENNTRGLFGSVIATAFSGLADSNRDTKVDSDELLRFAMSEIAKQQPAGGKKLVPARFVHDPTPPRFSVEARAAITNALRHLKASRFDDGMTTDLNLAINLTPKQPEGAVVNGLVLLKHGRSLQSLPAFERVTLQNPEHPVAHQALAWQHFNLGKPIDGISDLRRMVTALPETTEQGPIRAYVMSACEFAGTLRSFALLAMEPAMTRKDVEELDKVLAARGDDAKAAYRQGVEHVRGIVAKIDEELESDQSADEKVTRLRSERRRLAKYSALPYETIITFLRAEIEN